MAQAAKSGMGKFIGGIAEFADGVAFKTRKRTAVATAAALVFADHFTSVSQLDNKLWAAWKGAEQATCDFANPKDGLIETYCEKGLFPAIGEALEPKND